MKNIIYYIIIATGILIGNNVFCMSKITDTELGKVYAKSGVNIVIDDVTIFQKFGSLSYIDLDGGGNNFNPPTLDLITYSKGAKISLKNLSLDILHINQLLPGQNAGELNAYFDTSMSEVINSYEPSGLTIDVVDEIPILSIGYNYMMSAKYSLLHLPNPDGEKYNKVGIVFRLPTLDIFADEINIEKIAVENLERDSLNNGQSFFPLNIKNMDIALLGGYFEITSHQYCGIDIATDDVVIYMNFDKISICDPDGTKENNFTDGGVSLSLNNVKVDVLKINALTHTNFSLVNILNLSIQSPGKYNAHLQNLSNYKLIDLADVLKSFHGQPLFINVSRQLPGTTDLYKSMGVTGSVAGIHIALPTVEMYMDNFRINKITIDDPSNVSINNGASLFGIHIKGAELAFFNGVLEISPH